MLQPSEHGSEAKAQILWQSQIDDRFEQIQDIEYDYAADSQGVPVNAIRVQDHHRQQGIRILVWPLIRLPESQPIIIGSDGCQWLALQVEANPLYQKPDQKVLAVAQTPKNVKFSFRIPGEAQDGFLRPPLWSEIYYDPASSAVVLLNKSDIPIALFDVSHGTRAPPHPARVLNPGLAERLEPRTWRITVRDVDILDFRILEKRPLGILKPETYSYYSFTDNIPSSSYPKEANPREETAGILETNEKHIEDDALGYEKNKGPNPASLDGMELLDTLSVDDKSKAFSAPRIHPLFDAEQDQGIIVTGTKTDQYQLTRRDTISSTSLSTVYTAEHSAIPGLIAVKLFKTKLKSPSDRPYVSERHLIRQADLWLMECAHLQDLQHQSIVRYCGSDARFLSIYMEYVDAKDLVAPQWMNRAAYEFQGDQSDASMILMDISNALSYLQSVELVHNDIKPASILFSIERGAVLCDFGLSRRATDHPTSGGTPYYIPPEFIGRKLRGHASDVWALGVTMLYVLRKIPLPESRSRRQHPKALFWQIANVNKTAIPLTQDGDGKPAIDQMREWLSEIEEIRKTLNNDDMLERLVAEMLCPTPDQRISITRLSQELMIPKDSGIQQPVEGHEYKEDEHTSRQIHAEAEQAITSESAAMKPITVSQEAYVGTNILPPLISAIDPFQFSVDDTYTTAEGNTTGEFRQLPTIVINNEVEFNGSPSQDPADHTRLSRKDVYDLEKIREDNRETQKRADDDYKKPMGIYGQAERETAPAEGNAPGELHQLPTIVISNGVESNGSSPKDPADHTRLSRRDLYDLEKTREGSREIQKDEDHDYKKPMGIYSRANRATAPAGRRTGDPLSTREPLWAAREDHLNERYDKSPRLDSAETDDQARDPVQEEANRYYRELNIARRIATDEINEPDEDISVIDKWRDENDDVFTIIEGDRVTSWENSAKMSNLQAIFLAFNILRFISFGKRIIQAARNVYSNALLDDSLTEQSIILKNISPCTEGVDIPSSLRKHERDLIKTAEKCQSISRSLRGEIAYIVETFPKNTPVHPAIIGVEVERGASALNRLANDLENVERNMSAVLLEYTGNIMDDMDLEAVRSNISAELLWYNGTKTNDTELEPKPDNEDFLYFIEQYRAGFRGSDHLIRQHSQTMGYDATSENGALNAALASSSHPLGAHHLVSEHLSRTHHTFSSNLDSFIRCLNLGSLSRLELASAVKPLAQSGFELLAVVDRVYDHMDNSDELAVVRVNMFGCIQHLISSARETLTLVSWRKEDVVMPHVKQILLAAATSCVRASDDCVANTKAVIYRIGDLEIDVTSSTIATDLSIFDIKSDANPKPAPTLSQADSSDLVQKAGPASVTVPTDSGYASAPTVEGELGRLKDCDYEGAEQQSIELDVSDAATEYSTTSSMATIRQESYIWELAVDLFSKINTLDADETTQRRVSTILPELLKAFALKVGHDAPTQMHRDVMAFVHRNRRAISTAFTDMSFKQIEEDAPRSAVDSEGMDLKDRMRLWFEKENVEDIPPEQESDPPEEEPDSPEQEPNSFEQELNYLEQELVDLELEDIGIEEPANDDGGEFGQVPESWLLAYQGFISGSEDYEWLLTRLRREFHLIPTGIDTIKTIRETIISLLPSVHTISRKSSSRGSSARFELEWDVLDFFEAQGYSGSPDEVLEGVITLTGSYQDAQAATCAQYIRQTWPLTGEATIQLVKGVLKGDEGDLYKCKLSDGTTLNAWIERPNFIVEAYGVAASMAEIGEQLAWLGAALRTSPRHNGLVYCIPSICKKLKNSSTPTQTGLQSFSTDMTCGISFTMEEAAQPLTNTNGQCWHAIFRNPVIVTGYPIPQRAEWNTGLEISLNIMAGLARTRRIDRFKERVYIKGFSTMLVPIKRHENIITWHLISKEDGSRISYLDDNLYRADQEQYIGRLEMEGLRHVLGWCSEAKFYAGSAQAYHPVGHSRLPKPHAGCALAGVKVSPGRMIMEGPTFHIGARDTPVQVSHKGTIRRLKWISTKFVLLWDERDKRGWLVNGTSALLHIVRASLLHSSEDDFQTAFLFKSEDLQEARQPHTAKSAVVVLLNDHNRDLKLYKDDEEAGGYILLKSQIDHFYNLLEKLIDHQSDISGDGGVKLRDSPRRYLEGWDFEDLATDCDPLYPRVATIEAAGKGWVDFTRAIHAVTLVGRGFGDIIQPAGPDVCEYWAHLPKDRYYIASCLSDLERPMKEAGDYSDHVRLSDGLICHTPAALFMTCRCRGSPGADHCEPVQSLFPTYMSRSLFPRIHPIEPRGLGAVIFGQSSNFQWTWGDVGPPQEGELMEADTASDVTGKDSESFQDSGIGRSLPWAGSERHLSTPSVLSSPRSPRSPSQSFAHSATLDSMMFMDSKTYTRDQYTVGIICALPKELMAVRALFDDRHHNPRTGLGDSNQYALGEIAGHWIVAACLPAGEYGTNSAADVASNMKRSFPFIRFCLLVGIAGGVPSEKKDIRLGDVVVGLPTGTNPGVLQYDRGKENEGGLFQLTGSLQRPPRVLTNAINVLQSDPELRVDPLGPYVRKIVECMPEYQHPGSALDVLFKTTCTACPSQQEHGELCPREFQRIPRATTAPVIHYGLVASGNRVVKDAAFRDRLAAEYDVLCFEMEAAGIINTIDCLVIRGICDYCDASKNDVWQEYAAATAAAYAKLLLCVVAAVDEADVGRVARSSEEPMIKKRKFEMEYA